MVNLVGDRPRVVAPTVSRFATGAAPTGFAGAGPIRTPRPPQQQPAGGTSTPSPSSVVKIGKKFLDFSSGTPTLSTSVLAGAGDFAITAPSTLVTESLGLGATATAPLETGLTLNTSFTPTLGAELGVSAAEVEATAAAELASAPGVFSTALAGAGVGALIGAFNPLVEKQLGGSAGGAIGGAIGNIILPGIGGVIGGLLGSTIGGQFGAGPPVQASEFSLTFDSLGKPTVAEGEDPFGSKTLSESAGKQVAGSYGRFLEQLSEAGIDTSGIRVHGGFNDKIHDGFFVQTEQGTATGTEAFRFNTDEPETRLQAFKDVTKGVLANQGRLNENNTNIIDTLIETEPTVAEGAVTGVQVPVVAPRQETGEQSFSEFLEDFKRKQEEGAA